MIQLVKDEQTNRTRAVEYPVLSDNFRMLFPDTSFPGLLTPELVEQYGFGIYDYQTVPSYNSNTHKVNELEPLKEEDTGIWRQQWEVIELTDEEKSVRYNMAMNNFIQQRMFRLQMSDWTQLPDAPITANLKTQYGTYRQALRDMPQQSGFNPFSYTWPVEPTAAQQAAPNVI